MTLSMNMTGRIKKVKFYAQNCFVPYCRNTKKNSPDKLFVCVPQNRKVRKLWFQLARRPDQPSKSTFFCCQDHFNLKEDMRNYIRFSLMGGNICLKKDVVPRYFNCQPDRKAAAAQFDRMQKVNGKGLMVEILSMEGMDEILPSLATSSRALESDTIPALLDKEVEENNPTTNQQNEISIAAASHAPESDTVFSVGPELLDKGVEENNLTAKKQNKTISFAAPESNTVFPLGPALSDKVVEENNLAAKKQQNKGVKKSKPRAKKQKKSALAISSRAPGSQTVYLLSPAVFDKGVKVNPAAKNQNLSSFVTSSQTTDGNTVFFVRSAIFDKPTTNKQNIPSFATSSRTPEGKTVFSVTPTVFVKGVGANKSAAKKQKIPPGTSLLAPKSNTVVSLGPVLYDKIPTNESNDGGELQWSDSESSSTMEDEQNVVQFDSSATIDLTLEEDDPTGTGCRISDAHGNCTINGVQKQCEENPASQTFGDYLGSKLETYSNYVRGVVLFHINNITFQADKGDFNPPMKVP